MRLADFVNGNAYKPEDFGENGTPVVRIKHLLDESAEIDLASVPPRPVWLQDGDLVFSWSATLAVRFWNRGKALLNQHLFRVDVHPGVDPRWFAYVLEEGTRRLEPLMHGSAMTHITLDMLKSLSIAQPPLTTQRSIADYLDSETSRIDALISAKRRVVALLEERWVAVRGQLSGVASTDDEWASVQLRRIACIQAGAAFPHANQGDAAGTIPYIKVGDLSNVDAHDRLGGASNRVSPEVAQLLRSPVLPSGTIVLPKIGAALLTNRRAVLSEPSCLDQNVMGVTVHDGIPEFVYYCLSSIDLGDLSTPGPVPLLNEEAALAIQIPWPPIDSQRAIVQALDTHRAAVKTPVALLAKQRDVLQERRQALVTAAITGQLEIPEAA